MAIFGIGKVTANNLPDDWKSLNDKGWKCYLKKDYEGAFLCYEKMNQRGWLEGSKLETLGKMYAEGKVCQQDLVKARQCYYKGKAQSMHPTPLDYLEGTIGPTSYGYRIADPDYDLLILTLAKEVQRCQGSKSSTDRFEAVRKFHLLRDLIHLCESGMKKAKTQEELQAFLAGHDEWEYRFYGPSCTGVFSIPDYTEKLIALISEGVTSLVVLYQLQSFIRSEKEEERKQIWRRALSADGCDYYTKHNAAQVEFEEKYGAMTAQEMLDALYAEEAAWQADNTAELKAARAAAEAERIAAEERAVRGEALYRSNLLLSSGLTGQKEAGLSGMMEAAALGNERAKLWLLKEDARSGNGEALCILGDLAMTGQWGVTQDEWTAYEYYLSAAAQGHAQAAANLSALFRDGLGEIEASRTQAEWFLQLAAELGHYPSCLIRADHCMREEDNATAEKLLLSATAADNSDIAMAAIGGLAGLYCQQGKLDAALSYAVRFAKMDYAQEPEDQGWAQHGAGVARRDPDHLYEMYRVYCLYKESGPAKRHLGRITLSYRYCVGLAFGKAYCEALRPLAKAGNLEACTMLYLQLWEMGERTEALRWTSLPLRLEYPKMLRYAILYADELDLPDETVHRYRKILAASNTEYSEDARLELELEAREKAKQKEYDRMVREHRASQRQAAIDTQVDQLRQRMDARERDLDLALTGQGFTVEERGILGDISPMTRLRHEMARDAAEAKLRKKLEE